ncbi:MAG TPA: ABC transporter permease [Kaistia sp.]|jgi:ribose/xylose/arabinose/galactoside ABC-type transport system permease subunit|nr:ABC transporter permease [Kaistia sp.]
MSAAAKRVFLSGNFLVLVALFVVAGLISPYFWTTENLLNVIRAASLMGIVAIGMNVVILAGGIDLSVGSVAALTGAIAASVWLSGAPPLAFVAIPILVAVLVGLANGFLITAIGLQPFVGTLILMTVVRGAGLVYTNGQPIYANYPEPFRFLSNGWILGLPAPAVIFFAITLVTWYALKWRVIGRQVYAIGANETAARLSGVQVNRVKLATYVYSALLAGVAGLILTARMGSGEPGQAGQFWELDAIAAVVIGGTALQGGKGSVWGAFVGALIIGIVSNLFNLLGVAPQWQQVAKGGIILIAVGLQYFNDHARVAWTMFRASPRSEGAKP